MSCCGERMRTRRARLETYAVDPFTSIVSKGTTLSNLNNIKMAGHLLRGQLGSTLS